MNFGELNRTIRTALLNGCLAALACGPVVASQAQAQDDAAPSAASSGSQTRDTIVVTVMKREQSELEVSASLDVLGNDMLERDRIIRIEELAEAVPNVNISEFGDGQYRLIYRGIGATGGSDNQNYSTAIDGVIVPYGRAYRLFDLERVEVLRGPQGTLYGRNTNAGVIAVVTRDGSEESDAYATAYYGSGDTWGTRVAAGGPVGDSGFFFRLAGRFEDSDGFHSNSTLGLENSNTTKDWTLRGTVGWQNEDWKIKLSLTYDEYDNLADNLTPLATPYVSPAPDLGTSVGKMILPILTIERELQNMTLTSISSYTRAERDVWFSSVVAPVFTRQFENTDAFSQELRLAGTTDAVGDQLDWLVGFFFLKQDTDYGNTRLFTAFNPPAVLLDATQAENSYSIAGFAEGTLHLSDHWQVTAGVRVAYENRKFDYQIGGPAAPLQMTDTSFTTVQPKFVLAYFIDPDRQVYASVTRGFRPGSVAVTNPIDNLSYDDENIWQYEIGFKGAFADNTVELELAGFYIDWNDLQVQRVVVLDDDLSAPVTLIDNASQARSWGFEASLTFYPVEGLQITLDGGYTNAQYTSYEPSPGLVLDGNKIEFVPEFTLGASFFYRHQSGFEIGADLTWVGKMTYDDDNEYFQPEYVLLNASIAYEFDRFRIAVVGHNLLDEVYATRGFALGALGAFLYAADPRTVTGEVTVRF